MSVVIIQRDRHLDLTVCFLFVHILLFIIRELTLMKELIWLIVVFELFEARNLLKKYKKIHPNLISLAILLSLIGQSYIHNSNTLVCFIGFKFLLFLENFNLFEFARCLKRKEKEKQSPDNLCSFTIVSRVNEKIQ